MNAESKSHRPRRTWLVRPKLQWGVALSCFVVQMVAVLVYQATFQLMGLHQPSAVLYGVEMHLASDVMTNSLYVMLITCLVTGTLAGLFGLWASHKVYGPLPRFRRAFQQAIEGDRSVRLTLRPGDTLTEIAEDFNELMETLEQQNAAGRSDASDVLARDNEGSSYESEPSPAGSVTP